MTSVRHTRHPDVLQVSDVSAQRQAATDPTTPAETLTALSGDAQLAALVAANPNAPIDLLFRLAADHPRAVLDNFALKVALFETPDAPSRMPLEAVAALTRFEDIPLLMLKQWNAAINPYIVELAEAHVGLVGPTPPTPADERLAFFILINRVAQSDDSWFRLPGLYPAWFLALLAGNVAFASALSLCPDTPANLRRRQNYAPPTNVLAARLASPSLSPDEIAQFAAHREFDVRIAVARRSDIPASVRQSLAQDRDYRIRHVVAIHPQTAPQLLAALARDPIMRVRYGVALNEHTPAKTLRDLACDPEAQVRAMVARNPTTPVKTLEQLINDSPHVRASLARNPACPERIRLWLLDDPEVSVRRAVIQRVGPTTPGIDLPALIADVEFSAMLAGNVSMPESTLLQLALRLPQGANAIEPRHRQVAEALANNPATPTSALERLAQFPDAATQAAVARHPKTAPAVLAWLCEHATTNRGLALNLSHNPNTPASAFEQLVASDDCAIVLALAARLAHAPDGLARLYHRLLHNALSAAPSTFDGVLRGKTSSSGALGLSRSPEAQMATNSFLRHVALASPLLTDDEYAQGGASPLWSERYVLAKNPATPRATLEALAHDGIRYVRAAARAALATRATRAASGAATTGATVRATHRTPEAEEDA